MQFLRDIRGLAKQTQRWHKENLNALEKVLCMQGVTIEDCRKLTVSLLKEHFVFYMLEELGLKVNTINGFTLEVPSDGNHGSQSKVTETSPQTWSYHRSIAGMRGVFERVRKDIVENGMLAPLLVQSQTYVIVDGHMRQQIVRLREGDAAFAIYIREDELMSRGSRGRSLV